MREWGTSYKLLINSGYRALKITFELNESNQFTTASEVEDLPVPRTRYSFHTDLIECYQCRQADLEENIFGIYVCEMRELHRCGEIIETPMDMHPSPSAVSQAFHSPEEEVIRWKLHQLQVHYLNVFAVSAYFTIILCSMRSSARLKRVKLLCLHR